MGLIKIHHWPLITSLWFVLTFVTSYAISVSNGHVYKLFPYISDTGTLAPESCVFGQMMNIGAVFMLITIYFRYRSVEIKKDELNVSLWKWNKIGFVIGVIACFGVSMVGNFQETSNIGGHLLGANLAFVVGAVHFAIEAYITCRLDTSWCMRVTRILLSLAFIPFFIMTSVASTKSMNEFMANDLVEILKWSEDDPAHGMHLLATFSEWLMAVDLIVYLFTYTVELREMEYGGIVIKSKSSDPLNWNTTTA